MQPVPVSVSSSIVPPRLPQRTVLLVSADASFRQRITTLLHGLRWQVREAVSGSQAWAEAEQTTPAATIVDSWLPDLNLVEFLDEFRRQFPQADLVTADGATSQESPRGPYRQELLYALRSTQEGADTAAWNVAPDCGSQTGDNRISPVIPVRVHGAGLIALPLPGAAPESNTSASALKPAIAASERIPELVGTAPCLLEVSRRIRLVAPRTTPVLIEGPTGSGKELVAEALHRLSPRHRKPMVAINCAAIPEALLEAELFGHTRGAFTGAVQGRVGRIEAADGGTLFLDEIGEMPLGLQSKLLRFVECGELQRVGDNETVRVDVRIIAATHRPLAQRAADGNFRSDLYYRLAVFLVHTPALAEHIEDLPQLVDHFLSLMGREAPVKRVDRTALSKLTEHSWPGNVRELAHVLERAVILAGDEPVLTAREIDFGLSIN
jgi:DNA-binding NtrC family response regulator